MGSPVTYARYLLTKVRVSFARSLRSYETGDIKEKEIYDHLFKNLLQGRLTFKHLVKGVEMTPTFASQGETLLIRPLPRPSPRSVFVGDVVMLKDPENPEIKLVRRVAALEGEEMVSSSTVEKPFRLPSGSCWVLCDNETLSPKVPECRDSRSFGPLPISNIIGRAIYGTRSPVDHGFVVNSDDAMHADSPVLAVELDVEDMTNDK
jgi:inner membrane protease subunit 1